MEVLNTPIGVVKVKQMHRIWNQIEMIIRGEVITTSGFSENILGLQNTPIGMAKVKRDVYELKSGRNVNYELSNNYFRFFYKNFVAPKHSYWNVQSEKDV